MATPFITAHSIDRYRERVDPGASRKTAIQMLLSIVRSAEARSRPRHWTCVDTRPGCRYLYSASHPGICLVERDGAIVTVFSRSTCAQWKNARPAASHTRLPEIYRRPAAGTTWGEAA